MRRKQLHTARKLCFLGLLTVPDIEISIAAGRGIARTIQEHQPRAFLRVAFTIVMEAYEASLSPQDRKAFWVTRFNKWREDQEKLGPTDILKISYQPSLWLRSACDIPDKLEFRPLAAHIWKEVDRERLKAAYAESVRIEIKPPEAPWILDADPKHATLYRHNFSFHQFGTLIPEARRRTKRTYSYNTFKKILKEVADSKQELHSTYPEWKSIRRYVFLGHAGCTFAVEPGKNIGQLLMFKKIVETIHSKFLFPFMWLLIPHFTNLATEKQGGKGPCEMYASVELKHHSLLKPEKFVDGRIDTLWSSKDFRKELTKKGRARWESCLSKEKEFLKKEFDIILLSRDDILGRKSQFTDAKDTLLFAPNSVLTPKDLTYINRQSFQILICRNLIGRQEIKYVPDYPIKTGNSLISHGAENSLAVTLGGPTNSTRFLILHSSPRRRRNPKNLI